MGLPRDSPTSSLRFAGEELVFASIEHPNMKADVLDLGEITLSKKNIGVSGRVVDEAGAPLAGVVVKATDSDDIKGIPGPSNRAFLCGR
jgi:hypothetical protein